MKERPILMTTESVKAILDGRKSQTRRVVTPQPHKSWDETPYFIESSGQWCFHGHDGWGYKKCPYGAVGDLLWVRETWKYYNCSDLIAYKADGDLHGKWRPSIFMPRWASRLTLEITKVRVERLQEITEEDAFAEGCKNQVLSNMAPDFDMAIRPASDVFRELWNSLNAKRGYSWENNPFVWVISFKVVK